MSEERERDQARTRYIRAAQLRPDGTPSDMHAALKQYWAELAEIDQRYGCKPKPPLTKHKEPTP